MAKLMSVSFRPCLTAPSEKTVKWTTGAPVTVTAGTPLACNTENADDELVDVSFAGLAAAVAMAPLTDPDGGGVRPAAAVAATSGERSQYEGRRPEPCDRTLHRRLHHFLGSAFLGAAFFMSLTTTWSRTAR